MKRQIHKLILLLFFTGLSLSGCTGESLIDGTDFIDDEEVEVTFRYTLPGFSTAVTPRGAIADHESRINSVIALVYKIDNFGVERLVYYRMMMKDSLEPTGTTGTFKMRLAKSVAGEKYTFDFCFNPNSTITNLIYSGNPVIKTGATRNEVQQLLRNNGSTFSLAIINSNTTLPKWAGITTGMEITASTVFPELKLFQCLARIDVGVNLDENDVAQGLDNFKLNYLYLYGMANSGLFFPDINNIQGDRVIAPSLASPYSMSITANNTRVVQNNKLIAEHYFFEQDVNFTTNSRAFTIIIRGTYTDPQGVNSDQYYPVRFFDPDDPDKKLPILRNSIYRINILGISGPGYTTIANAAVGESTHIKCELHVQENGDINHVVYNNQHYLGVSDVSLEYDGTAATRQMKVKTDVPGGWSLKVTDDQGNIPGWISCTPASSASGNVETVGITLQAHSGPSRSAILTFTAGPLSIQTRVVQN